MARKHGGRVSTGAGSGSGSGKVRRSVGGSGSGSIDARVQGKTKGRPPVPAGIPFYSHPTRKDT
jgi:hypothetical protein